MKWNILSRLPSWLAVRILQVGCLFCGHRYGQHFNDIFHGGWPDETSWCSRCGAIA